MTFRPQASIDPNQHKGLILLNSITGNALVATGLSLTNAQPLHVAIVDGSGSQISTFGGGTQYTDGGTPPAHPIGPTIEFDNGGTWATVSSANPLPVTGGGGGVQYIDGAIPPTHPTGTTIEWNDGLNGIWQTVGLAQPLPISIQNSVQLDSITSNTNDTANNTGNLASPIWGIGDTFTGSGGLVYVGGVIRSDSPANVSTATGQVETLQVANGRLWASAKIDTALPAGSNVIGHVITDTGSTTAVTGTVTVSGTITTTPPSNASTNIAQINAVTPLMGNGATGTGSLRVTIASDNTAFSVNSTLSAETTKVIGTVRNADGAGNLWTSNSSTFTAKFAQDTNLLGTLGTAFSTAGKVDIKGADGDVFVRQATASNLNATVVGTGTFAVQAAATLAAETTKVIGVTRSADGAGNLLTSTTNALDINIKSGNLTTLPVTNAGTFAVQATLAAETTKVIGVVRTSDGAGNLLTSNSTTPSAHFALDQNITSILGTAPTTVGKLDIKGADGDVFVRQATAANLNATVTQQTLTKGTQGATGVSTQDLKDAGRSSIMVTASVASTAVAETLITISISKALAAVTTASSNTITTGKKFRIQGIYASARNSTGTTTSNVSIKLRAAVAGATTTASPLQLTSTVNLPASAATTLFPPIMIPDGFEIDSNSATNTWGITITHPQWVTASVVATFDITLVGYEY